MPIAGHNGERSTVGRGLNPARPAPVLNRYATGGSLFDCQVISNRERARHSARCHVSKLRVHGIRDHALERYATSIDHDVYGWVCALKIPIQTASANEFAVSA